jgi:hypothetical protein
VPFETFTMSKEDAVALHDSRAWEKWSPRRRAIFQLRCNRLCMPMAVFHEAIEKAAGRPVWTHELAMNRDGLYDEIVRGKPAPTMEEIIGMLPMEEVKT